jgi:hypothetical protein
MFRGEARAFYKILTGKSKDINTTDIYAEQVRTACMRITGLCLTSFLTFIFECLNPPCVVVDPSRGGLCYEIVPSPCGVAGPHGRQRYSRPMSLDWQSHEPTTPPKFQVSCHYGDWANPPPAVGNRNPGSLQYGRSLPAVAALAWA